MRGDKLNPQTMTKGVLSYCQVMRKRNDKVAPLSRGQSFLRKLETNPNLISTAPHTFYGKKLTEL